MFFIEEDMTIHLTRGDTASIIFGAAIKDGETEEDFVFSKGDVVRFKVFERKDCGCVVLQKDIEVPEDNTDIEILLNKEDTKIGELISKPKDYWYEVELNPETKPQTIVCYDENGPKLFRLYPEGEDA